MTSLNLVKVMNKIILISIVTTFFAGNIHAQTDNVSESYERYVLLKSFHFYVSEQSDKNDKSARNLYLRDEILYVFYYWYFNINNKKDFVISPVLREFKIHCEKIKSKLGISDTEDSIITKIFEDNAGELEGWHKLTYCPVPLKVINDPSSLKPVIKSFQVWYTALK
jgi:hypothetical protein